MYCDSTHLDCRESAAMLSHYYFNLDKTNDSAAGSTGKHLVQSKFQETFAADPVSHVVLSNAIARLALFKLQTLPRIRLNASESP